MLATGHSVLPLYFRSFFLRGRLADRHQTLPHVRRWPRFTKLCQKFGWPLPPEIWRPKTSKFQRNFAQLRDLIANISRTQKTSSIGKRRCKLRTLPHRQTYFGPQISKNRTGVLTHPTGGHHDGHCHASSYHCFYRAMHVYSASAVFPSLAGYCHFCWLVSRVARQYVRQYVRPAYARRQPRYK